MPRKGENIYKRKDGRFGIAIALFVVAMIVAIIVYGGAFIGGFHSLKNYILAFKHNVVDSNRKRIT